LRYPALDIAGLDGEMALAFADDYQPTAVEERDGYLTMFFGVPAHRDQARAALARQFPAARFTSREVDDGDWVRRSQANLGPVTVDRITIAPPWFSASALPDFLSSCAGAPPPARAFADASPPGSAWPQALPHLRLVIRPSMAFGTGHHATTRLCLAALQALELSNRFVIDVGTGSGVLAIAARALGARAALGIDNDPDAIACANENLRLNAVQDGVTFEIAEIAAGRSGGVDASRAAPPFQHREISADVITANLTGGLLRRSAPAILDTLVPGGTLIMSGILETERDAVVNAFGNTHLVWEAREDEWVALALRRRPHP
jgi:ribosomal protein L11 methyltransferase